MTDTEKALGSPTGLTFGLWGFFVVFLIFLLVYVLVSPLIHEAMKVI